MNYGIAFVFSILELVFIVRLGMLFIEIREGYTRKILGVGLYSGFSMMSVVHPPPYRACLLLVGTITFYMLVFKGKWSESSLISLCIVFSLGFLSILCYVITQYIFSYDISDYILGGSLRNACLIGIRVLCIILVELISKKRNGFLRNFLSSYSALWFFGLLVITVVYLMESFRLRTLNNTTIIMIIFSLLVLCISWIGNQNTKYRYTAQEVNQRKGAKEGFDLSHSVLSLKHDLKNHLIALWYMVENGNKDGALEYIESIQDMHALKGSVHTKNDVINAIVNDKIIRYPNIHFILNIDIDTFCFGSVQLSILLGNGLDNAIEAVLPLDKSQQWIEVHLTEMQQYGRIEIRNPYRGTLDISNQRIYSHKRNHELGYGLRNIENVVKELDGLLDINTDDNIFKLTLLLRK